MTRAVRKIVKLVANVVLFLVATIVFISAATIMGEYGMPFWPRIWVMCSVLFGQALIQFAVND